MSKACTERREKARKARDTSALRKKIYAQSTRGLHNTTRAPLLFPLMSLRKIRIRPARRTVSGPSPLVLFLFFTKPSPHTHKQTSIDRGQEFEDGFQLLSQAITEIFRKNAKSLSYEVLYRTTYNLTLHQFGEKLYDGVTDVIARHLESIAQDTVVPAFADSSGGVDAGAAFLKTVKRVWDDFTTGMDMIQKVLNYLVTNTLFWSNKKIHANYVAASK